MLISRDELAERFMLTNNNQSAALMAAIKEYDANKWKVIGAKVGKPAKVCGSLSLSNLYSG